MNDEADQTEDDADDDEAAECRLIAVLRQDDEDGREEGKARAEIGRDFPLAQYEVEECADAVEEQHGRRIDVKENRNEHR